VRHYALRIGAVKYELMTNKIKPPITQTSAVSALKPPSALPSKYPPVDPIASEPQIVAPPCIEITDPQAGHITGFVSDVVIRCRTKLKNGNALTQYGHVCTILAMAFQQINYVDLTD
jgi:hypothetical protein